MVSTVCIFHNCTNLPFNLDLYGVCTFDNPNNRTLNGYYEAKNGMTIEMCISICSHQGFKYSGLEWGCECYCGDEDKSNFKWAWPDLCDSRCSGDSAQICGGTNAINIYTTPTATEGLCAYDNPGHRRVLKDYFITGDNNMTIEKCGLACTGYVPKFVRGFKAIFHYLLLLCATLYFKS